MLKSLLLAAIITTSFSTTTSNQINRLTRLSSATDHINRRKLESYGDTKRPTPCPIKTPLPTKQPTKSPVTTYTINTQQPTQSLIVSTKLPPASKCTCDFIIGNHCYCEVSPISTTPPPPVPASKSKSKSKSKPKPKHAKSKGAKKTNGLGIGDCDCEGGQIDLALRYTGTNNVNIKWYYSEKKNKEEKLLCINNNVESGEEIICDTQNPSNENAAPVEKFGTETYVEIIGMNKEICGTKIHTSCSQDIVGTYGDNMCDIIVTGWKDKNNLSDGLECRDRYVKCDCMM